MQIAAQITAAALAPVDSRHLRMLLQIGAQGLSDNRTAEFVPNLLQMCGEFGLRRKNLRIQIRPLGLEPFLHTVWIRKRPLDPSRGLLTIFRSMVRESFLQVERVLLRDAGKFVLGQENGFHSALLQRSEEHTSELQS